MCFACPAHVQLVLTEAMGRASVISMKGEDCLMPTMQHLSGSRQRGQKKIKPSDSMSWLLELPQWVGPVVRSFIEMPEIGPRQGKGSGR